MVIDLRVKRLPHGADLPLPTYTTARAAGMDLRAATANTQVLAPGERAVIPTGVAVAIPERFEGQIRSRSGLALRHGIVVLNSPGTIDADYRGEIKVLLWNTGREPFTIKHGMRIAQLVVAPVVRANFVVVKELDATARSADGFGSTGI